MNGISRRYCNPECKLETKKIRLVKYKNNTEHKQEYCLECGRHRNIPKHGYKPKHVKKNKLKLRTYETIELQQQDLEHYKRIKRLLEEALSNCHFITTPYAITSLIGPIDWAYNKVLKSVKTNEGTADG